MRSPDALLQRFQVSSLTPGGFGQGLGHVVKNGVQGGKLIPAFQARIQRFAPCQAANVGGQGGHTAGDVAIEQGGQHEGNQQRSQTAHHQHQGELSAAVFEGRRPLLVQVFFRVQEVVHVRLKGFQ